MFEIITSIDELRITDSAKARGLNAIVVHHSYGSGGNAPEIDKDHREDRGWLRIGYHTVVGNGNRLLNGAIQLGRDLDNDEDVFEHSGAHVLGFNAHTIGICGIGNFDDTTPDINDPQIRSIGLLVAYLMREFDIPLFDKGLPRVIGHREAGILPDVPMVYKSCPGNKVDCNLMRAYFYEVAGDSYELYAAEYAALMRKYKDEGLLP